MAGNHPLEIGLAAYERGEWVAAAKAVLSAETLPPTAHETLGKARWWLDDPLGSYRRVGTGVPRILRGRSPQSGRRSPEPR
jgi:hypothetical protein